MRRMIRVFLPLLILAGTSPARAHPVHSSYAEADYRPASGKLEIAWRLFTDDAEVALSRQAGRRLSATRAPATEFDSALLDYVRSTLVVKTSTGSAMTLQWVGRELADAGQHLWVYVECALPGGPAGARLANRGLRETFSDQINSVRVRDHSTSPVRQVTLLFVNDTAQTVNFGQ